MQLEGKVAVVTGAAIGTGRAIARRLAAEGAEVVVADRDQVDGLRTVRLIGGRARFVRIDLSRPEAVGELPSDIDVLVNNAGGGPELRPCFPAASPERWGAALDLNLRVPMLATQQVLEPMRERGGGVVVNIGSTAGLGYDWHVSPEYSAAKAGLIRFTATLAPLRGVARRPGQLRGAGLGAHRTGRARTGRDVAGRAVRPPRSWSRSRP